MDPITRGGHNICNYNGILIIQKNNFVSCFKTSLDFNVMKY